jgi:hypothetical protein
VLSPPFGGGLSGFAEGGRGAWKKSTNAILRTSPASNPGITEPPPIRFIHGITRKHSKRPMILSTNIFVFQRFPVGQGPWAFCLASKSSYNGSGGSGDPVPEFVRWGDLPRFRMGFSRRALDFPWVSSDPRPIVLSRDLSVV